MVRSTAYALLGLPATLLLSGAAHAWEHLDQETFLATSQAHQVAVVAFIRSDDPGNAALESEWNTVKTQTSIPLLSVDCQAEGARHRLCSSRMYDPANLPVISMLERGNLKTVYPGPRRASAITQWINRAGRTSPTFELTASSLAAFKTADEAACALFLHAEVPSTEDEALPKPSLVEQHWRFIAQSTTLGGRVSMGTFLNPPAQILADEGLAKHDALPAVKCWKNTEGGGKDPAAVLNNNPYVKTNKWLAKDNSKTLSGAALQKAGVSELEQFIVDATRPVIGEWTVATREEYLNRGKPIVFLFAATEAERSTLRTTLSGSAITYADSLSIVTVDPFAFPKLQTQLGLFDPNPVSVPETIAEPVPTPRAVAADDDDDDDAASKVANSQADSNTVVDTLDVEPVTTATTTNASIAASQSTPVPIPSGAHPVTVPGKPVGVLVQLWTGNIWHYPTDAGFTVKELMSWGLKVKLGAVAAFREADVEWMWPKVRREEFEAEQQRKTQAEDRARHDEL